MFRSISLRLAKEILHTRSQSPTAAARLLSTQQQKKEWLNQNDDTIEGKLTFEDGYIKTSPYEATTIPTTTLDQYVWGGVNDYHDKIAAVCGVTGREYTYAKLRDCTAKFAVQLQKKFNLKKDDVVAICMYNSPEFPIAALGAIEAGLVITTINPIYTAEEISKQLINSNAKVIIGTVENYTQIKNAIKIVQKPIKFICANLSPGEAIPSDTINFFELINDSQVDFSELITYDKNPNDTCFLPYSSGTTGMPKGVELSHTNLTCNSEMLHIEMNGSAIVSKTTDSHQDILTCVLPFFHIYGWTTCLLSKLHLGCKLVTLPKFHPQTFLDSLAIHKPTVLHLVPPIIIFLGHHDKVSNKHTDSVQTVMSGAAPLGGADAERLIKRAPHIEFMQGYGMTEASPVVLMGFRGNKKFEASGYPCPLTQAKIIAIDDPEMKGLGANQNGELLVRGPQVMKGYLNNKTATDEVLVKGGWLRSGDIAYYDSDDGQFHITDRLKELIKVKGYQVAPAELEEILRAHPKLLDAGVVGISHPISGEVPRAFVVSKPGCEVTEQEIKDYVAKKVAVYKKLEGGVTFLDAIPKNATGKILRRQLKADHC